MQRPLKIKATTSIHKALRIDGEIRLLQRMDGEEK